MVAKFRIGKVLEETFATYVAQLGPLLVCALLFYVTTFLLVAALASGDSAPFLRGLAILIIALVGFAGYEAAACLIVQHNREGTSFSPIDVAGRAFSFVPRIIGAAVMLVLAMMGLAIVFSFVILTAGVITIGDSSLAAVLLVIGLLLAMYVVFFSLVVRWCLIIPVIVIEQWPMSSFTRSGELIRGKGLKVFVLLLVTSLASMVVTYTFRVMGALGGAELGDALGALIAALLTAPFFALTTSVTFFHLKDSKDRPIQSFSQVPPAAQPDLGPPGVDTSGSVPPPS